ncbi:Protein transporter SEC24 [Mycena venus]|uniref:Protein transporter SEC24 n=1 Tax=Mycena venus TaxID=2733690 RepID=A0A8H7D660_9AGAR|nr:Protein transporter SEC24 [Mycena venus]
MRWTSPPTRREISLIIFSLTVFALSYNIDSSIRLVGLNKLQGRLGLGLGRSKVIGADGRRPAGARDALENQIYGDWAWDAEHIAGDGLERSQAKGVGRHGAMWVEKREVGSLTSRSLGETTVDQAFWRWGDDVPRTTLKKHLPGYTVIDNIILFNGSMNIVTDQSDLFPPIQHMVLSTDLNKWKVITPQQAREQLGSFGGRIRGVTWMGADSSPHNSTLLALWRTYSTLDPNIGPDGSTKLAPPRRLIYPYYGFFTDPNPEHADVTTRRQRVVNGIHPELVKAAFPSLTVMYYADWEDYHMMEVPFVIERLVIADRTAARYGAQGHEPIYAPAFKFEHTSEYWWEPIRRGLATYFEAYGENAPKKTVTYVSRQSHTHGLRLSDKDHSALVDALRKLERDHGYEVHIVSNIDEEMSWSERLRAIVRSSVMLGVHDSDLLDSTFARDQELVAKSVGMHYIAWWNDRQLSGDTLPAVSHPDEGETVPIDVSAIISAIPCPSIKSSTCFPFLAMASPGQLPPGWIAEWNEANQRYLFIDTATSHTQWEEPVAPVAAPADVAPVAPTHGGGKRRQYAAGQTQAYYSTDTLAADPGYYSGGPSEATLVNQPAAAGGGQLFTPGLAGENQFQAQQGGAQQPAYYQPDAGYGQQQPAYGTQPAGVDGLANQFSGMGLGGQKQFQLNTINMLTSPPEPTDLHRPPPEIRLPPGSCISPAPTATADPSYQRLTLNAIPTTSSLLGKVKIPLALVITPYRTLDEGDEPIPLVTDVIARCRRCRMYINAYVQFIDGGNRWRCCMCNMSNEVPQMFDWDQQRNQPGDRWQRAELNHSVVEFVAPTEYMVRAPQPAVYIFLIDVSHSAVQSGMVATATRALLENLDRIPDDDNITKVGIICYDVSLYFFSMAPGSTDSTMLVVSDIDDVFLPKPTDLLVNLSEARPALEALLGRIGEMFQDNSIIGSALGPALQAGSKLMAPIGGKILALSSSLPSVGEGALKNREDPKILGTSKESSLLQAANSFYKTFAIDCSRAQVTVDMFLFSSGYQDVASLANLPHYTTGQTYYYPAFNAARSEDALKFAHEFGEVLAMPIMLECITRVRLRMASFHGNFFVRSTDLLAMPTVPQNQSYAIEIDIEDTLTAPFVVLQTGMLHTTAFGERRLRVITTAYPTTSNLSEVFASADQIAIATLLANKAVERSLSYKLEDARDYIFKKLVEIFITYKSSMTAAGAGASAQLALAENLKMLPVLVLGLLKNVGIRQSAQIPPDIRAYSQALLTSLPSQLLIPYLYPTFYSLHTMPAEAGTVGEKGVIMPPALPLTSERLERHGLFLIEDGQTIFLWVGRDAVPQLIMDVFDLPNYEVLRGGKTTLPVLDNPFSQRVNAIIQKTREMRRGVYYPHLYVVKEDGEPPLRLWALSALIQDRADVLPSYQQFISSLKEKVNGVGY